MKSAKANRSVFLQKENTSNKKMNEVTGRASVFSFTKLTAIAGNFLLPRKVKAGFDSPHHHLKVIDFAKRNLQWLFPASIGLLALQLYCVEATSSLGSLQVDDSTLSEGFERMKNITVWSQACSVWVITLMLVGLCEKLIKRRHRALTFLVGASYWLYLTHRPLCVAFAAFFQRWAAPGILKYAFVCGIVTVICLWSYQVMVRRSLVGVLLDGRKM